MLPNELCISIDLRQEMDFDENITCISRKPKEEHVDFLAEVS